MLRCTLVTAALGALLATDAAAQVSFERLRAAAEEPHNWLTYSGTYFSQRYSELDQVTPANVADLSMQWMYQARVAGTWQASPVVVDGVMYLT
ncbi:MAG: PQQ-dependent dehydrogenase, methanol/ethanol family, partial [Acidobacteria bacterium]|nr:PQQ-dependent dehydrogenase, methanol/ethanol family [Acidobacteriota bacterium]